MLKLHPDQLVRLAPRLKPYLRRLDPSWPEIVDAAGWLRHDLDVSKPLWGEASITMGREQAAIAIAIVSTKDFQHFRTTPGGYFHGMVVKAKAGEGRVHIGGHDVTGWPTHRIAQSGVGYVPEGRHMFRHLTVEENLRVPPPTAGQWSPATVFTLFPRLGERRSSKAGRLSGGEQEMLAIARALLLNPRLLLLDEPSQGLAPVIVEEVMQAVQRMRGEGTAILLVEQNAILALAFADRAYVLSDGAIIHEGPAAALAADSEKVKALAGARASRAA